MDSSTPMVPTTEPVLTSSMAAAEKKVEAEKKAAAVKTTKAAAVRTTKSTAGKTTKSKAGKTTKSKAKQKKNLTAAAAGDSDAAAAADIVKDCRVCWSFMADADGICHEHGKRVTGCPPDTCAYSPPDPAFDVRQHAGSPSYSPTSPSCYAADADTQCGAYSPPHSPASPLYSPTSPSYLPRDSP